MNSRGERYPRACVGEPRYSRNPSRQLSYDGLRVGTRIDAHVIALDGANESFGHPPFPPMVQVGALVRELVLEKVLASEALETSVIDRALAYASSDKAVDVLEQ